jgi:predicted ArsR family transcriptional regulator
VATFSDDTSVLAVLAEPQRARLYDLLVRANAPCTLAEISRQLGIGRTLAAFHVERLESAGLVTSTTEDASRPRGRGRPAHLYRAVPRELIATVPPRRYDVLAEILVQAAGEQQPAESFQRAALRAARRRGAELARQGGGSSRQPAGETSVREWLCEFGYVPAGERSIVACNCPFARLRALDTELVCSLNVALVEGYLDGVGAGGEFLAVLRPDPPHCCVVVEATA